LARLSQPVFIFLKSNRIGALPLAFIPAFLTQKLGLDFYRILLKEMK
jgi:hypothetical protein